MTAFRKAIVTALVPALAGFAPLNSKSRAATNPSDPFPMQVGTSWVYRGTIRWYDMKVHKRMSASVTSRSEVVRAIQRDGLVAALLHGFPSDFDWSEGGAASPSDVLVVSTSDGHINFSDDDNVDSVFEQLENSGASAQNIFDVGELQIQLPLKKGMKFCGDEARRRPDDYYCWVVAATRQVSLKAVKGVKTGTYTSFLIQYVTNPDDTEFEFVPGVGFISYRYHHHGTVADTDLQLVEYHAGGAALPGGVS